MQIQRHINAQGFIGCYDGASHMPGVVRMY